MKLWKTRNMALAVIFLVLVFGIFLNCGADKRSVTGGFAMKDIQAVPSATAEDQLDPSKSLFGNEAATNEKPTATGEAQDIDEQPIPNTADDDPDADEEEGLVHEIPQGLPVQGSAVNQTVFARALEVTKVYVENVRPKYGFTYPTEKLLALGHIENGRKPMCLGAKRGDPCPESNAKAHGTFQVLDSTGAPIWNKIRKNQNEAYEPDNIEHNMAVSVALLETLESKHGENAFRAYNGGAAPDKASGRPNYDKPSIREKTLAYDKGVRESIPIFKELLAGKIDIQAVGTEVPLVQRSTSLPPGSAVLTSSLGEPRPYRHGIHQGVDEMCPVGTPALAIRKCKVTRVGWHKETPGGNFAGVQVTMVCGNGTPGTLAQVMYFHLSTTEVQVGDVVEAGRTLAHTGDTGGANGKISSPHLHLGTKVWAVGGKMVYDNPCNWTDCSSFAPESSLYQGPKNGVWKSAKKKFLAKAGIH